MACKTAPATGDTGELTPPEPRTLLRGAVPTAHLVEGDDAGDFFTLVMEDARFMGGGGGGNGNTGVPGGVASIAGTVCGSSGDGRGGSGDRGASIAGTVGGSGGDGSGGSGDRGASTTATVPDRTMGMSLAEAEAALEWLASFHAQFWAGLPDSPRLPRGVARGAGGYWGLATRAADLDGMEAEWANLVRAFPGDPTLEAHRRGILHLKIYFPELFRSPAPRR